MLPSPTSTIVYRNAAGPELAMFSVVSLSRTPLGWSRSEKPFHWWKRFLLTFALGKINTGLTMAEEWCFLWTQWKHNRHLICDMTVYYRTEEWV